jgi:hypothetical protein
MLCVQADQTLVEYYRGDSLILEVTVRWEDGTLADLSLYSARFRAANTIEKDSSDPHEIKITDAVGGKLQVYLWPADSAGLNKNYDYSYEVEIYNTGADLVYTVVAGIFRVI